jgi:hypothetical protein
VSSDGADGLQKANREPLDPPSSFVINTSNESKDVYENPNGSVTAAKHATTRPLSPYPNVWSFHSLSPPRSNLSCLFLIFLDAFNWLPFSI